MQIQGVAGCGIENSKMQFQVFSREGDAANVKTDKVAVLCMYNHLKFLLSSQARI